MRKPDRQHYEADNTKINKGRCPKGRVIRSCHYEPPFKGT